MYRVLPTLSDDLILGDTFLRVTETWTTFKHRIVVTVWEPDKQVMVQFADRSMMWTSGVVHGLKLVFEDNGKSVKSDFYVLGDLAVDVLFSSNFALDKDVFVGHERSFYRYENPLNMLLFEMKIWPTVSHFPRSIPETSSEVV
ncbi:hypothetical protein VTI74DRAFT_3613 [Chaetomium olivicolor]